jgi:hypothetical protein
MEYRFDYPSGTIFVQEPVLVQVLAAFYSCKKPMGNKMVFQSRISLVIVAIICQTIRLTIEPVGQHRNSLIWRVACSVSNAILKTASQLRFIAEIERVGS